MKDVKKNSRSGVAVLPRLIRVLVLALVLGLFAVPGPARADAMDRIDAQGLMNLLEQERGKVVLVNFWASWCGPCRVEMPFLIKLREAMAQEDLFMVGVALDFDADAAANFAEEAGLNFPIFHAWDDVMPAFAVGAIPKTMIWDREGRLRIEHVGVMASEALFEGVGDLVGQ
ncbi:TlpA disulfide reductase family protein [Desulfovibrio ferrophilus]|uniref:Alkyl hydroperoxide reductase/ Thiol specific antioxidant/ Mal allergen n=1 Tax=Desulfovibrio ferrophilus TaxID=241368 RepID=A0A2Z6AUB1_9BACT|nr:TlpA disulfide reductase family protein [Desulfovibrio ferrophilus]BBD06817.1 alkyl hydroperoxide reductase/ Thiol specific antioxidant/ Mal allergen [Desulfovibrio ferrophilus]